MKYLCSLLLFLVALPSYSQIYQGHINEAYEIVVEKKDHPATGARNPQNTFSQLPGFPVGFRADANTKNFRNVTLADLNQDGIPEILFAAASQFYVFSNNEILWQKTLTGTGIYPPSVADIDNDGDLEIVQVTGGNLRKGRVYLMDHEGNNLAGFPKSFNDNWILTTAALSDVDGDNQLEIILIERQAPGGNLHILTAQGDSWSTDWPIRLPGTPAVTPTIGDIDTDGQKEIVIATTTTLYAFDLQGNLEAGWPVENPDTKFSFQSPVLADLDGNNDLEIIGATHGNTPEYYVLNHDGTPYGVWPFLVPEQEWTFSTPTVVELNGATQILMSRPKKGESVDMLYAWNEGGDLLDGFPIESESGLEGIISVANIDADADMELIFGSNRLDANGFGFLHAYKRDGSGEVTGFPIRTYGWTLLNGAALGDVNGDGQMDLTALSYTTNFGAKPDSIFLNVYDLATPYAPEKILWSSYKGSNSRTGNLAEQLVSNTQNLTIQGLTMTLYPNPVIQEGQVEIHVEKSEKLAGKIVTLDGKIVYHLFDQTFGTGNHFFNLPKLSDGIYFLNVTDPHNRSLTKRFIVQKK